MRAMMDLSDGLSTDLRRMCAASGVGAVVDAVPVAPGARAVCEALGAADPDAEALGYALHGGEDFELMVAVAPRAFDHLSRARLRERDAGGVCTAIGTVNEERGRSGQRRP